MRVVPCLMQFSSVAFARGNGPSLNHMAYEMPNIDGLMSGAGLEGIEQGYELPPESATNVFEMTNEERAADGIVADVIRDPLTSTYNRSWLMSTPR